MKILILGAGRVGRSVAENLVSDANDITIVDESADRIAQMQERFDLRGIVGDASSPSVLSSAMTSTEPLSGVATGTARHQSEPVQ